MPGRLNYTNEDYLNLFAIYVECDKVISRTCDTFAIRYPQKQRPSANTVKRIIEKFLNFGSVKANVKRNKPVVDDENIEIAILGYFTAYPSLSTRQAALESGLSQSSVIRILRKHKFFPYSYYTVQHLKDTDFQRRVEFCEFILVKSQENNSFLNNIIWTDEAKFTKNGIFNRKNSHYWSDTNLHQFRVQHFQEVWQFNVFCAIRNDGVIALEFYQENLNGERYLNILRNLELHYLDNLPLADHRNLFYQLDGAPPHNGYLVCNYLNQLFHDQWIGNNGPFLWPPRSPDLTVLDFFIWGTVKNQVYNTALTTMENCMQRVRAAFEGLSAPSIRRATHEQLLLRCEKCLEVDGRQFEHLLK